jgi:hypothetical protein
MLQHFFFPVGVHGDVNARVLIELNEFLHEGESHSQHFLPFGKVKLFLKKRIVQVKKIDLLATPLKLLIAQLRRVQHFVFLEDAALVADVASVEDIAHVSLKKHHHCSETVIGIEKSDLHLQTSRHLQHNRRLKLQRVLLRKDLTMHVRLGNFCSSICLVSWEQ